MLKVSWLHSLLRIAPGRTPKWVCSPNSCTGLDFLSIVCALIFILAIFLAYTHLMLAATIVALLVLFVAAVMMPFEACERTARARRRRNECVFCGRVLENQSLENPPVCGCRPDVSGG
jgi:cobalamin biosynthesis protein CobD/CbiB